MPSPQTTLIFAAAICALLLLGVAALADFVARLRDRVDSAERESRRLFQLLDKYQLRLSRAELQIDGLSHRVTALRNELVADDEGVERARAELVRKLGEPPRM
jgi:chromosome segregation ATPase